MRKGTLGTYRSRSSLRVKCQGDGRLDRFRSNYQTSSASAVTTMSRIFPRLPCVGGWVSACEPPVADCAFTLGLYFERNLKVDPKGRIQQRCDPKEENQRQATMRATYPRKQRTRSGAQTGDHTDSREP